MAARETPRPWPGPESPHTPTPRRISGHFGEPTGFPRPCRPDSDIVALATRSSRQTPVLASVWTPEGGATSPSSSSQHPPAAGRLQCHDSTESRMGRYDGGSIPDGAVPEVGIALRTVPLSSKAVAAAMLHRFCRIPLATIPCVLRSLARPKVLVTVRLHTPLPVNPHTSVFNVLLFQLPSGTRPRPIHGEHPRHRLRVLYITISGTSFLSWPRR
jgi:hypothetical protein